MGISTKTRKMLWGRSACRCNYPDCRIELAMDSSLTDDESLVGEECHIVAQKFDGPRGQLDMEIGQNDKYGNLILMCNTHHKLIDDQPNTYSVEVLNTMKKSHEEWVRNSLALDEGKIREDELYCAYIDKWVELAEIFNWRGWTSYLVSSGQPHLSKENDKKLNELRYWLLNRVWPKRYTELEEAFNNFRMVLEDLYILFHSDIEEKSENFFYVRKFYNIREYDEVRYSQLLGEYNYHVYLIEDLVLELTRAGNYVCDMIRKYVLDNFMINEGRLLITYGPDQFLKFITVIVEYIGDERILRPYPGLEYFKEIRFSRDYSFG